MIVKNYQVLNNGFELILINDPCGIKLQENDNIEEYIKNNLKMLSFYCDDDVSFVRLNYYLNMKKKKLL